MLSDQVLALRAAITFLTRLPLGSCSCTLPKGAAGYFPLVGTIVGAIGLLVWRASSGFDVTVRAWLVTAALLLVTGAFHEDGLADTADALGGSFGRERLFEILKDSRIGSFGALTLITVVCLRTILWRHLLPISGGIIVIAQTLSRLPPVIMLYALPYVTSPQNSRSRGATAVDAAQVALATCWSTVAVGVFGVSSHRSWVHLVVAISVQFIACSWLGYRFMRRAGGLTGDFLGATQQLGELALLMSFARVMC